MSIPYEFINRRVQLQKGRAADAYDVVARTVSEPRTPDSQAFNLEHARYLREGGPVRPGTLDEFLQRMGIQP